MSQATNHSAVAQFNLGQVILLISLACVGLSAGLWLPDDAMVWVAAIVLTAVGLYFCIRLDRTIWVDIIVVDVFCWLTFEAIPVLYRISTNLGLTTFHPPSADVKGRCVWAAAIFGFALLPAAIGIVRKRSTIFGLLAAAFLFFLGIVAIVAEFDQPEAISVLWTGSVFCFVSGGLVSHYIWPRRLVPLLLGMLGLIVGGLLVIAITGICLYFE